MVIALIALAFWQKSNYLMLIGGIVAIGFGVYWAVSDTDFIYIMTGVASSAVGFYMLIDTAIGMFRR